MMLTFLLTSLISYAAPPSEVASNPLMTPEEQEVQKKARKRNYPGGRDEENLKVQTQLSPATRKMGPATEAPEPAEPAGAND